MRTCILTILALLPAATIAAAQTAPKDADAELRAAIRNAARVAGPEFASTILQLCTSEPFPLDTSDRVPAWLTDYREPPRESWYVEPAKVFDNFYFVGDRDQSAWALTTSDGIILFDTNIPYRTETVVLDGLRKLELDPRNVRYLIISHAHGDHIGAAKVFQERYGSHIVMSDADWQLIARYPNRYKTLAPRRDVVVGDGSEITLGGSTVTAWLTPGHTPGTLSFTFPVLDRGKRLVAVYSGGTGFNFANATPDIGIPAFQLYIDSQKHIAERAATLGATVFVTNHSTNDNAINKLRMIAGRGDGPNPFEIGADQIQRYFKGTAACARVAQQRLEQKRLTP